MKLFSTVRLGSTGFISDATAICLLTAKANERQCDPQGQQREKKSDRIILYSLKSWKAALQYLSRVASFACRHTKRNMKPCYCYGEELLVLAQVRKDGETLWQPRKARISKGKTHTADALTKQYLHFIWLHCNYISRGA